MIDNMRDLHQLQRYSQDQQITCYGQIWCLTSFSIPDLWHFHLQQELCQWKLFVLHVATIIKVH